MNQEYRDATTKMEEAGVNQDYIIGWQGGFLGHPMREEQRITEAYEAGYNDGEAKNADNFSNWK
ncbi:MAG: Alvin_2107 family globule sulfur oxidation protein [bacterium]